MRGRRLLLIFPLVNGKMTNAHYPRFKEQQHKDFFAIVGTTVSQEIIHQLTCSTLRTKKKKKELKTLLFFLLFAENSSSLVLIHLEKLRGLCLSYLMRNFNKDMTLL